MESLLGSGYVVCARRGCGARASTCRLGEAANQRLPRASAVICVGRDPAAAALQKRGRGAWSRPAATRAFRNRQSRPTGRPDQRAASTPCRRGPRSRGPLHWTSAGRGIRCSSCTKWRPAGCSARTPAGHGARHHDGVADDPSQRFLVGEVHPDVVATTGSFGGVRSAVGRWSRRSG
jgi:hypothetical protein